MKSNLFFGEGCILILFAQFCMSCSADVIIEDLEIEIIDSIKYVNKKEVITDFKELSYDNIRVEDAFTMDLHANNSFQGLAIYEDYLFQTYHSKSCIDIYDLTNNKLVYSLQLNPEGKVHCNNADFGSFRYDQSDIFPLLYLENRSGVRTTSVYRIVPNDSTFNLIGVQSIEFSPCSWTITNNDCENSWMYITHFGEKNSSDTRTISKINIPEISANKIKISLDSTEIIESFNIQTNKVHQDATIYKNKLFQLRGGPGSGDIYVYDLIEKRIIFIIDWKELGMQGEPEGIGWYKDHLVISNNSGQVYNMYFVK